MNRSILRKTAVGTAGGATIATGVALLVLPGPGTLLIIGGLALLGKEFPAARRMLDRARDAARRPRNTGGD
jgi:hypothetical protein